MALKPEFVCSRCGIEVVRFNESSDWWYHRLWNAETLANSGSPICAKAFPVTPAIYEKAKQRALALRGHQWIG